MTTRRKTGKTDTKAVAAIARKVLADDEPLAMSYYAGSLSLGSRKPLSRLRRATQKAARSKQVKDAVKRAVDETRPKRQANLILCEECHRPTVSVSDTIIVDVVTKDGPMRVANLRGSACEACGWSVLDAKSYDAVRRARQGVYED